MLSLEAGKEDWAFSFEKIMDPLFSDCNWLPWDRDCEFDETPMNGTKHDYVELMDEYWSNKLVAVNFSDFAKKYTLSFYWSAMSVTTLGEQPEPDYSLQNLYEIGNTVIGVILFAVIMGSVSEIIATANTYKREVRSGLDQAKVFMANRSVEQHVQTRVFTYFDYAISTRQFFDDPTQSDSLTTTLRRDVRKTILMEKFRRVGLFKNVSNAFLEELIAFARPRIYCPHDYFCLKGDVCREMLIVEKGLLVELRSGRLVRRLAQNDSYGELSLIYVPENRFENRHASTVVSVAFSEVYVLAVDHFRRLLKDFPSLTDDLTEYTRSQLARMRMLRSGAEMELVRQMDEPTLDLDDSLEKIRTSIGQIDIDLASHVKNFETDRRSADDRLNAIECCLDEQFAAHGTTMPKTSSNS